MEHKSLEKRLPTSDVHERNETFEISLREASSTPKSVAAEIPEWDKKPAEKPPPREVPHERNDESTSEASFCDGPSPPKSVAPVTHKWDKKKSLSETYSKSERVASILKSLLAPSLHGDRSDERPFSEVQSTKPSSRTRFSTFPPARTEHQPSSPAKRASKLPVRTESETSLCRKRLEQVTIQQLSATPSSSVRRSAIPRLVVRHEFSSSSGSSDAELMQLKQNEENKMLQCRLRVRRDSQKRPAAPPPQRTSSSRSVGSREESTSSSGSSDAELIQLREKAKKILQSCSREHCGSRKRPVAPLPRRTPPPSRSVGPRESTSSSGSSDVELIRLREKANKETLQSCSRVHYCGISEKMRLSSGRQSVVSPPQRTPSSRFVGSRESTSSSGSSDAELMKLENNVKRSSRSRSGVRCGLGKTLIRRKPVKKSTYRASNYFYPFILIPRPYRLRKSNSSSGFEDELMYES